MTDEEFVAWEAEQPLRPVCPDWCVSQWCAVAPQVIGRQVAFWHGWHRSSMWTVPVEYGEVIEVAAGAAEDVVKVAQADGEPIEYQVIMRHLDRQEDGERTTELTLGEAEQLVHALRRSIEDARRHVEFDERRRSSG